MMRGLSWLMMWGCILERKHQEMYDTRRCCSYRSTRSNIASLLRRLERREGTGSGLGSKISMSPHLRPATHFLKLVFTSQRFPKCCNSIATQEKWHSNIWVCGRTMLVCLNCVLCLQVLSWVFVYLCLFFSTWSVVEDQRLASLALSFSPPVEKVSLLCYHFIK